MEAQTNAGGVVEGFFFQCVCVEGFFFPAFEGAVSAHIL